MNMFNVISRYNQNIYVVYFDCFPYSQGNQNSEGMVLIQGIYENSYFKHWSHAKHFIAISNVPISVTYSYIQFT